MNSLVVFLSVVALVAGKPSGLLQEAGVIAYSSPIIAAAPAAVSHQSRLDIKSSPAVVATETIAPIPAVVAAPLIAKAAIAPAAVSSQSRIDIKSTPAITSTVVSAPIAYSAYSAPLSYAAPFITDATAPAFLKTPYAAPEFIKTAELAPAFTATAAIATPAVSLYTPEFIAARNAHFEAKAPAGEHVIHKRSAPLFLSTPVTSPIIYKYAATPIVHAAPLTYSAPIAYSTPLITKAYGVHPW